MVRAAEFAVEVLPIRVSVPVVTGTGQKRQATNVSPVPRSHDPSMDRWNRRLALGPAKSRVESEQTAVPTMCYTSVRSQHWRLSLLKGEVKEHWIQLCEQADVEQDPERLMGLVREMNRMLEEKEQRLKREQSASPARTASPHPAGK